MILGHAHKKVINALNNTAKFGTSFGTCHQMEVKLAELVVKFMPSIEMIRMVNSGTEATMSAIRLARAFTGKGKILKFEGCYHGHGDSFLIKAGSGVATLGLPDSPGISEAVAQNTLTAKYNDLNSLNEILTAYKNQIAAIILEPVVGNMGCVMPDADFLKAIREICTSEKIVLIFDEVMTGFRVAKGGAQELFGIKPDLTTLGKIIGGGLPVGAYGGRKDIMQMIAPNGPVYQAGTLSGNPLAMTAGYETLRLIDETHGFYIKLNKKAEYLIEGIRENLKKLNLNYTLNNVGSMFTLFFTDKKVTNYDSAKSSDTKMFSKYFREMLNNGIYLPPSQFEAAFISIEHDKKDLDKTIKANYKALKKIM
jgi:glutamate-1-semialdehyde 2,1-aminomutase